MNEDQVLNELSRSAKETVQSKYPFDLNRLETKVLERVRGQERRRGWQFVTWSAGLAVCAALLLNVFHAFDGSNSPFFGKTGAKQTTATFEYLQPDEGFANALKNGYPLLPAVKTERNGYTVEVKDAMIDEKRFVYTMIVSGEKIEAIAREKDEDKKAEMLYHELTSEFDKNVKATGMLSTDFTQSNGIHYLIMKGNYMLKQDAVKHILSQPKPVLPMQLVKRGSGKNSETLAEIALPLTRELVAADKIVKPTAGEKPQPGTQELLQDLKVTQIEVSPTVMRVKLQAKLQDGYKLKGLAHPRLIDGKGTEYPLLENPRSYDSKGAEIASLHPEYSRDNNHEAPVGYYLDFIPSFYFNEIPNGLKLQFDGMEISTRKKGSFAVNRNGKFPLEAPFGSKTSRINRVYYDQNKLFLVLPGELLTEETVFTVDGVAEDEEVFQENDKTFIKSYSVPKKDTYQVETARNDEETIKFNGLLPVR